MLRTSVWAVVVVAMSACAPNVGVRFYPAPTVSGVPASDPAAVQFAASHIPDPADWEYVGAFAYSYSSGPLATPLDTARLARDVRTGIAKMGGELAVEAIGSGGTLTTGSVAVHQSPITGAYTVLPGSASSRTTVTYTVWRRKRPVT